MKKRQLLFMCIIVLPNHAITNGVQSLDLVTWYVEVILKIQHTIFMATALSTQKVF